MVTLFDTTILTYILFGTAFVALVSCLWAIVLHRKINRLLGGSTSKDLTHAVTTLHEKATDLAKTQEKIHAYLSRAESRMSRSIQGVATVRFNPFKNQGGGSNQSFATALLDEEGNGVVISSLYSRDRVGVYAKPIEKGTSSYELTDEEKSSIELAYSKFRQSKE